MRTLRAIGSLGGLSRARVALSTGLGALAAAFGVALLTTAGYLISRAAERPPVLSLLTVVVAVRFFGLARPLARYLDRLASHDLALRTLGRIRSRFYKRLEPLAPAGVDGFRRGDLLTRMIADVDSLQGLYPRVLQTPLVAIIVGAGCIATAFWLLPVAAITLAVGLTATGVALPIASTALTRRQARDFVAARAELRADLIDLHAGAAETLVFGCESRAVARIADADRRLASLARRDAIQAGLASAAGLLASGLTVVAVLLESAQAVGVLDRVWVVALTLLAMASFDLTAGLPAAGRELMSILASGRRVLELYGRVPVVCDPGHPLPAPPRAPEIALEQVTARYADGEPAVLEGFDLRLGPGRRIAIVGPSGAGKTTIVNLLLRFLDPEQGRVTIAGRDARDYRQEDVRRTFAVAGQEAHVFDSSIRQNLLVARPAAGPDELERALRLARIDDWVASLPAGLDTLVGEDGMQLSGGQRQRLVLARALLADAEVLVLDEPTAHLDHPTAEALMHDVLTAVESRAVLLITHRAEGLESVDEVITLSEGRPAHVQAAKNLSTSAEPTRTVAVALARRLGESSSSPHGEY